MSTIELEIIDILWLLDMDLFMFLTNFLLDLDPDAEADSFDIFILSLWLYFVADILSLWLYFVPDFWDE